MDSSPHSTQAPKVAKNPRLLQQFVHHYILPNTFKAPRQILIQILSLPIEHQRYAPGDSQLALIFSFAIVCSQQINSTQLVPLAIPVFNKSNGQQLI